jgi:RHO1 GDP-GTP exchange protein 1/2
MEASPEGHEDHESIPHVIEVIKSLLKETEPGVASANQKVELWRYNSYLVFKPGEVVVSPPTGVSLVFRYLVRN